MAAAALVVRVSAQMAEFQKSFEDANKTVNKFADEFQTTATKAAAIGAFFGVIGAQIAGALARGLGSAISDAIKFSSEFSNAFLGLGSVARHFGTDTDLATKAARALSADGLLPLKDSATGLKNLLASGFNLDQATKLMNAFKDSAAFGKQGALSFGDAVRSATEGVKNGNSILVDNAGITKNLSQILKEAGFAATDLARVQTDAGVRLALYNGILKESSAFTGDAAKLTQTYTGQVTRLESAYNNTLATLGTVITQNASVAKVIGTVGDVFVKLNSSLSDNRQGFNLVSDGVLILVRAFAEVVNVVDLVQTAFAGLQQFSNRLFEAFSNIGIAAFKVTEKIENLNKILDPIRFQQHAAGAREAKDAYVFLEGASKGLRDASAGAETRSIAFGNALQGVRGKALELAAELAATRGKTVDLGTSSREAAGKVDTAAEALGKVAKKAKDAGTAFRLAVDNDMIPSVKRIGQEIAIVAPLTVEWASDLVSKLGNEAIPVVKRLGEEIAITGEKFATVAKSALFNGAAIGQAISQSITNAIQGGGDVFASAAGTIGQALTSGLAKHLTASIADGGKAIGGFLGGAINAVLPGLGALLGPIVGKITSALSSAFGLGTAGRDVVKEFAASFKTFHLDTLTFDTGGGFDQLQAKLQDLGAEGEKLWVALTQGVGRNNPAQAKAVIDLITEALNRQKSAQTDVGAAATAASVEQQAAADAVKARIAELGSEFSKLNDSVKNEAPEEVMGVIESLARARMDAITEEQRALQSKADEDVKVQTEAQKRIENETQDAHQRIQDFYNENELEIPYHFKATNSIAAGGGANVPALAGGGIVRRPTLALVGERGPEAVIPLSQLGRGGNGGMMHIQLVMPNGQVLLEQWVKAKKELGL